MTEMGTMPSLAQLRVKELPSTTMCGMLSLLLQHKQLLAHARNLAGFYLGPSRNFGKVKLQ